MPYSRGTPFFVTQWSYRHEERDQDCSGCVGDGDWRDDYGFSDGTLVYKGESFAQLESGDLALGQENFRRKYERYSLTYLDDNDQQLRDLITTLNTLEGDDLAAFAYQHIDVPQVVDRHGTATQNGSSSGRRSYLIQPVPRRWMGVSKSKCIERRFEACRANFQVRPQTELRPADETGNTVAV